MLSFLLRISNVMRFDMRSSAFTLLMCFFVSIAHIASAETDRLSDLFVFGRIWTADAHRPWAEAGATRGEKIVAVGKRDEVEGYRGDKTRVIDAGSGMVVPGLIDSHIHLIDGGLQLASMQLRDAKTRK